MISGNNIKDRPKMTNRDFPRTTAESPDRLTTNSTIAAMCLLSDFQKIKGIVIGRFQKPTKMSTKLLRKIISKNKIPNVPIISNVDFGHTTPLITFPIGGEAKILANDKEIKIEILEH